MIISLIFKFVSMKIDFSAISDNARLWIYQADRKLNQDERAFVEQMLSTFTEKWEAHGAPLKAAFKIVHDQFIVIAVDEAFNQASGCSIDSSVHLMQDISAKLGVDLFDRSKIAFIFNEEIYLESLSNLKSKVEQGLIEKDTLTFNNLISNKGELDSSWVVPAGKTWMSRYFN